MLDEAFELRKSILERAKKQYGFEPPNVIVSKSNLVDAYAELADYDTADTIYSDILKSKIFLTKNNQKGI